MNWNPFGSYRPNLDPDALLWGEWDRLVNMTASELRRFKQSAEGRKAGLSKAEATRQGIGRGQESANALLKMIPTGRSLSGAERNWSPEQWDWAKRQVNFIKRMRGVKGPLRKDGKPTRKLLALKIWGHDPEKE